jgi:CHAT domain
MRQFWFGKDLPIQFASPLVKDHLSFNGQLHFRCRSCNEVTWGDVTFATLLLKGEEKFPCPNCRKQALEVIQFIAVESRLCKHCGTQSFAHPKNEFECMVCHSYEFTVYETLIHPSYPIRLFVLHERKVPFGQSPEDDIDFLMEYVRGLRLVPQFHQTCIHLVAFIESIFKYVYGSSADASNFLNGASALMRTIYRETGNLDAAFLSIAIMIEGRDLAINPIQRAVFGFNINQNVYSVLARSDHEMLLHRFGFDLKEYGIRLSRRTLAEFEAIDENQIAHLRARQKWLLGDILKSSTPSEAQIDEALQWFEAALQDPALPKEVVTYVQESALTAQAKRQNLNPQERQYLQTNLTELAEKYLDQSDGLQRIKSLDDLLRGAARLRQSQRWKDLSRRCLGEAIIYTAANDPKNMLRNAGTILSQMSAGFAAERFEAGVPLEGIAGVEAFRSLAINKGDVLTALGHHVHPLEVQLMITRLLGVNEDPVTIAETILSQYQKSLERNIRDVLEAKAGRMIVWCEAWDGTIRIATIKLHDDELVIQTESITPLPADFVKAMNLPTAYDPPGRLRSRRLETALTSGWRIFKSILETEPTSHLVLVGSSKLGHWPIDTAEMLQSKHINSMRPITVAPTISVASAARKSAKGRVISNVLLLSYGGVDLSGTQQEIEDIKAIYGSRVTLLDGKAVGKADVLGALSGTYDIIHFCGHGEFNYLNPMQSGIYFHNEKGSDGIVTATDILSCKTIGRHPIIVLSACSSALVLPNGSNNFLGLAGALIRMGATAIVGARWPISDTVSAVFSKQFHTRIADGHSVDEAVSFAKNLLRDTRLDEWSAFMSIGD